MENIIHAKKKYKFNITNFNTPVVNNQITKYLEALTEGRHGNFNKVHSNVRRGQAGEHQKDVNRGLSQAVRKLADDGKDVS